MIAAFIVVFGVTCLVFFLIHFIPGDPIEYMLGESGQIADREALRHALGLDQAIHQQLMTFFSRLLEFDFGTSIHSKIDVATLIQLRLPATIQLAVISIIMALMIAFPLGVISAVRKDSHWDRVAMGFSLLGVSIPNFCLGPIFILFFSMWLGWFPVSGNDEMSSIILPAFTLATAMAAILARLIRSSVLEILHEDYVRTARSKGLSEANIILRHVLPNALLPVITVVGIQFGTLLGGAVITEMVFSWPGIGQLTIESIQRRDYPVVQACIIVISVSYVLVNVFTDLLYGFVDPRIRLLKNS